MKTKASGANTRLITLLGVMVIGMFAFGYALGPIYDVLCEITGLGGKTGTMSEQQARDSKVR